MRLHQIRVFLAVAESGSLRGAARALGVSQPAVSKSLRQLEEELRVHLFERRPHGVVATQAGRAFVVRARVVQSELRKAEEDLGRLSGDGTSSVALGAGFSEMALVVPDAIAEFRRQFPGGRVRVVEGRRTTLLPLVRDETVDFFVGLGPPEPGLVFRPLYRSDFVVAARKGHPLRNEHSLAGLAEAEWLTLAPRSGMADLVERAFASAGMPAPKPATVECESYNGVVAVLARTDMLGLITHRMLTMPFPRDLLTEIRVAEKLPSMSHGLFMRADARPTRSAAAMIKIVSTLARKLAVRR